MSRRSVLAAACTGLGLLGVAVVPGAAAHTPHHQARHVLLISVDGLHQSDLAYYVAAHPHSALADLVGGGTEYTRAKTTLPSDSFPGMIAQLAGGGPGTAGVYYDDTYNHDLLPPGTVDCTSVPRGTEVAWTEAA